MADLRVSVAEDVLATLEWEEQVSILTAWSWPGGYPRKKLSNPALPDPREVDVVALTRALCDLPSVSGEERALADAVEALLRSAGHLRVDRDGDTVLARS